MALERDIHDLLFLHDCVIVQGFGGFLTHYRPARLDEQRRLVHPPSKDLSFNRHLVRQDGLLVDRLIRREGLDFQDAKDKIEEELAEWRWKLQRQGRLEISGVGTFFHDTEHNLQFEPDKRVNFLKDAFGLRPVMAVPVVRTEKFERTAPIAVEEAPMAAQRRIPSLLAVAATVAVLFTAATWWAVSSGAPDGMMMSGLDLFRTSEAPLYALPKAPVPTAVEPLEAAIWTAPKDIFGVHDMRVAGPDVAAVAVDFGQAPMKAATPESTAVVVPTVRSRYHIIGGCFLEKENADRFISELQAKGFAASLIDVKGGLYRVAYGSYPLKSTALEALDAVRKEEAPDAWMLVK